MKAISIKQPWAYLIATGIKDIENRTWKCPQKYIGERVLIHASASAPKSIRKLLNADQINTVFKSDLYNDTNFAKIYNTGAVIGSVKIADCVINHPSIWAEETKLPTIGDVLEDIHFLGKVQKPNPIIYNWVLANPILFDEPIMNVKGKLGFWDYEFSEDDYECTNDNGYTLGSCGEKVGCMQDCGECDYYKSKYE